MADIFGSDKTQVNYTTPQDEYKWMSDWLSGVPVQDGVRTPMIGPAPVRDVNSRILTPRERMLDSLSDAKFMARKQRESELKNNPLVKGFGTMAENFMEAPAGLAKVVTNVMEDVSGSKFPKSVRTLVELAIENGDLLINPAKGAMKASMIITPKFIKSLNRHIDDIPKMAVPNAINMRQMMSAIRDAQKHGPAFVRSFDPKDTMSPFQNLNIGGTGSHHTALLAGMGELARKKGNTPVPMFTSHYNLEGPSLFGEGKEMLGKGAMTANTNREAMDITLSDLYQNMYMPEGGIINLSQVGKDLPKGTQMDMYREWQKQFKEAELPEILESLNDAPRFHGLPSYFRTPDGKIQPDFDVRSPWFSSKQASKYFNRPDIENVSVFNSGRDKRQLSDMVLQELKIPKSQANMSILHSPEAMLKMEDLMDSDNPVLRWIGQKVGNGEITMWKKGKPNPDFFEDLDDLLYKELETIQRRGSLRGQPTYDPSDRDALWFDLQPTNPNAANSGLKTDVVDQVRTRNLINFLSGKSTGPQPNWMERLKPKGGY